MALQYRVLVIYLYRHTYTYTETSAVVLYCRGLAIYMYTYKHRKSAAVLYYRVFVIYICILLVQFVGAFTYTSSQLLDGGEGGGEVDASIYTYIYI